MLDKNFTENALEQSASEIQNPGRDTRLNSHIEFGQNDNTYFDNLAIRKTENPDTWRLVTTHNDNEGEVEEVVFTIQGVLVSKELPLQEKPRYALNGSISA